MSDETKTSQQKCSHSAISGEDTIGSNKSTPTESIQGAMDNERKRKLDMTPPQVHDTLQTMVDASLPKAEGKMRADGLAKYVVPNGSAATDEQKIVYYLYGIEFCKNEDKETRCKEVKLFLQPDAKKRMMDLLKKDSDMSHCHYNVTLWREVQGVILCYQKQVGAKTIFDNKNMPVAMRTQATKNCYQNATGGTVGYKIAFDKGDNKNTVHTVDVPKFMRGYYNDRKLKKRVLENKGGKSQELLSKMLDGTGLEIGVVYTPEIVQDRPDYVSYLVSTAGPALISRFRTDDFFKDRGQSGGFFENGSFRIHQFDRENSQDTHTLFDLGAMTQDATEARSEMETKNKKCQEESTSASVVSSASVVVPVMRVPQSSSWDSHKTGESEALAEGAAGLHAMILIGSRKDASEKTWYLVQNTWNSLPVFEASPSFLAHRLKHDGDARDGALVFVSGTFRGGSNRLAQNDQSLCLESMIDDDVAELYNNDDDDDEEEEDTSIDLEE
jgi:hypothetical protein